jgi:hypothetical protein
VVMDDFGFSHCCKPIFSSISSNSSFLCFNKALSSWCENNATDSPGKKKIQNLHLLCLTYLVICFLLHSCWPYKTCRTGLVWSNSRQKKKAREILYKAHWTELLVSPWKNNYAELIIINYF